MKTLIAAAFILLVAVGVLCHKEKEEHGHSHPDDIDGEHDSQFDHEAILGSKDEDKEFADLPPEEAKTRLRQIAIKMDINGDGKVSKDELTTWVHKSFVRMDVDDAAKRLKEYDADDDKFVSWAEYMQNVYSYSQDEVKEMKRDDGESGDVLDMIDQDKKKFDMADLNKDGKLDKDEYSTFEHPYNYKHMQVFEVERMMKEHDKDKDGKITFEEFRMSEAGGGDEETQPDPQNEIYEKEQFTNLDKDKDGVLNDEEIIGWVAPDNEESAREEVAHLLEHADGDKDDKLTYDEIVNNHELFVGSQATDYGSYLHRHVDEL